MKKKNFEHYLSLTFEPATLACHFLIDIENYLRIKNTIALFIWPLNVFTKLNGGPVFLHSSVLGRYINMTNYIIRSLM